MISRESLFFSLAQSKWIDRFSMVDSMRGCGENSIFRIAAESFAKDIHQSLFSGWKYCQDENFQIDIQMYSTYFFVLWCPPNVIRLFPQKKSFQVSFERSQSSDQRWKLPGIDGPINHPEFTAIWAHSSFDVTRGKPRGERKRLKYTTFSLLTDFGFYFRH